MSAFPEPRYRSGIHLRALILLPLLLVGGSIAWMRYQTNQKSVSEQQIPFTLVGSSGIRSVEIVCKIDGYQESRQWGERYEREITYVDQPPPLTQWIFSPGTPRLPTSPIDAYALYWQQTPMLTANGILHSGTSDRGAKGPKSDAKLLILIQGQRRGETLFYTGSIEVLQVVYAAPNVHAGAALVPTWQYRFHGTASVKTAQREVAAALTPGIEKFARSSIRARSANPDRSVDPASVVLKRE